MAERKQTRKQAIIAKCLDCSGGIRGEVRKCTVTRCPLWPYRMGAEQKAPGKDESVETQKSNEWEAV